MEVLWKATGRKFKSRVIVQMMALWKARGGSLNNELDFR